MITLDHHKQIFFSNYAMGLVEKRASEDLHLVQIVPTAILHFVYL
jgi:hypothetical protein